MFCSPRPCYIDIQCCRKGRARSKLPVRTVILKKAALIPEMFRLKCWRMPEHVMSLWGIQNVALIMVSKQLIWSGKSAEAAHGAGMIPIICVGESETDRKAGRQEKIVGEQLAGSLPASGEYVIAYEPVWAIGTGLTASLDDIAAMHAHIRKVIPNGDAVRILYGGSVKPGNADDILGLEDVDGALIGGASLKASDFSAIIDAAPVRTEASG